MKKNQYRHLDADERDHIAHWRSQGSTLSEIAHRLGRDKSSISREIRRNKSATYAVYLAHKAQARSEERARYTHQRPRLKHPQLRRYVHDKLKLGWSPEQIAGRWSEGHPKLRISTEAIYQYLYDPQVRKQTDLVSLLPRRHKKRHLKGHRKTHRNSHIPNRIDISKRPQHIARRKQPGHWESDSVISRQSPDAVNVICERTSRYAVLTKMRRKSAPQTVRAVKRALKPVPKNVRRTITYDNGTENVAHDSINRQLSMQSYFCQPYRSWEKGTVENTIGLLRRVFPKKTDFAHITQRELTKLQHRLNNRPRKCLSFKTPNEVFHLCCT